MNLILIIKLLNLVFIRLIFNQVLFEVYINNKILILIVFAYNFKN